MTLDKNLKGLASTIYVDRDSKKVYTGEYAKTLYASGNRPLNTIRSIKTRLGGESMIEVPLDSDKNNIKNYDMTELSAVFLKTVKMSIDKQISGNLDEVTITVPAGFNSDERSSTIQAARMAGFKNVNLLDEPTAVLLNFLNDEDNDFDYRGYRFGISPVIKYKINENNIITANPTFFKIDFSFFCFRFLSVL